MTKLPSTAARQSRPAVRASVVVPVVAASLALGGCSFIAPQTSLEQYAPSDGLQVDLGDVPVRNVLVVSQGGGEPGVLSGALVNRGDADAVVLVEVSGTTAEVDVAAGETVFLAAFGETDGVQVVLDVVEEPAGGVVEVSFSDPAADSSSFQVPIVLPDGAYADITPGASAEPSAPVGEPSTAPAEPSTPVVEPTTG